ISHLSTLLPEGHPCPAAPSPPPTSSCSAATTPPPCATSSSCSISTRARPATWTDASSPAIPGCLPWAATPAPPRSAPPPRRAPGNAHSGRAEQVPSFPRLPGPPVVVFQDLDNPVAAATFGEIMCTTYKAFGAAGLVTSGAGRDLDQVEALNFPCF